MEILDREGVSGRLKALREQAGDSTGEMAEKCQTSRASISQYETGKTLPGAEFLVRLWLHYKADPIRLLTGTYDTVDTNKADLSLSMEEMDLVRAYRKVPQLERQGLRTITLALAAAAPAGKVAATKKGAK